MQTISNRSTDLLNFGIFMSSLRGMRPQNDSSTLIRDTRTSLKQSQIVKNEKTSVSSTGRPPPIGTTRGWESDLWPSRWYSLWHVWGQQRLTPIQKFHSHKRAKRPPLRPHSASSASFLSIQQLSPVFVENDMALPQRHSSPRSYFSGYGLLIKCMPASGLC